MEICDGVEWCSVVLVQEERGLSPKQRLRGLLQTGGPLVGLFALLDMNDVGNTFAQATQPTLLIV
jgi:hypothetical protein